MKLDIIILAAGLGKRMHSDLPKVLYPIGGVSMLERVVATASKLNPNEIYVIHGTNGNIIKHNLPHLLVKWVEQPQQLGTGHAVAQAIDYINNKNQVLILYGDTPLISKELLLKLISAAGNNIGIMTAKLPDPTGFGRIIRNQVGELIAIVEEKDTHDDQAAINEINAGLTTMPAHLLKQYLPKLQNHNAQKEYYLTDVIKLAVADNHKIRSVLATKHQEIFGINDKYQLAEIERYHQEQTAKELMLQGLLISDPKRFDLRGTISFGVDTQIDNNAIFEGHTQIGNNSIIGPNTTVRNSVIGNNVHILANCIIENATIEDNCVIGPFARIRPETHIKEQAKIGNFVEIKKSVIGAGSKANHLTYIGDTIVGSDVNIGAGTITCNYDSLNKHQTIIGDRVFIGSDCQLIAPVKIGNDATIGAGSTITNNAPAEKLTLSRAKQITIDTWQRPDKREKKCAE